MSLHEFDIISTYFNKPGLIPTAAQQACLPLGIGDDCALLSIPPGKQLAISMDILVADVHFPVTAEAGLIAQRALAVNLSDLAAMGATPLAFTLGLTLPAAGEDWLEAFSTGLSQSAQQYLCPLVGGDMTRGPLSIAIQVHGLVDENKAITRKGARAGDKIYVTGPLGAAGLALKCLDESLATLSDSDVEHLMTSYYRPEPRLQAGQAGVGLASAAIDISDGLLADLEHIARQSQVGMIIELDKVPVCPVVESCLGWDEALSYALAAGDDYELVFTVAPANTEAFERSMGNIDLSLTCIGSVNSGSQVLCVDASGKQVNLPASGYTHF